VNLISNGDKISFALEYSEQKSIRQLLRHVIRNYSFIGMSKFKEDIVKFLSPD
jgi:hypothetical protein